MRNLKRALSLALASVMLLGMMVVGTSAASYPDVDDNDNVEAIEVLNAVNVMIGRQGNFEPDEAVNRHEMAVIMAKLVLGVETADNYVGTHPFTDVVPWADKYVAACYENGLVAGTSATTYGGGSPLTAVQAAAMMLRALGYKDLNKGYQGDWRAPITAMANQIRLFAGVASNPNEKLNRNQVAQLALNTLKSPMVNLKDNTISWSNDEGQIIMTGGSREYIVLSSKEAYAQAINNVESSGTSASQIGGYTVELGEHLYNGKLKLNDVTDVFGRPAREWEYDGKVIGDYIKEELMVMDKVGKVTGLDLYNLIGKATLDKYALTVSVDGISDYEVYDRIPNAVEDHDSNSCVIFNKTDLNRNNKAAVGATGTGVLTQVFVDHEKNEVYVAIINTYLARATKAYDTKKEEATIEVYALDKETKTGMYGKTGSAYDKKSTYSESFALGNEDFDLVKDIAKDDPYLVTVADGAIQTIKPAEVLSDTTISAFKKGDYVVSGGTQYDYTTTADYNYEDLYFYTSEDNVAVNLKDITYNIFLDQYGNLIGLEANEKPNNYVFLTSIDLNGSNISNRTATANAIFLDGTVETISINMNKSTWRDNREWNNTTAFTEPDGDPLLNTWATYTKSGDVYTIKEVWNVDEPDGDKNPMNDFGEAYRAPKATEKDVHGNYNDTKLAQFRDVIGKFSDRTEITLKNGLRMYGGYSTSDKTSYSNVYGDSSSVYLTAEMSQVRNSTGTVYGVIKGVETVHNGIDGTSITIWDQDNAYDEAKKDLKIAGMDKENVAYGVYTLYNDKGIVIAAMIVGEGSSSSELVYVTSGDAKLESDNGGSAKAAGDGLYTWTREVVRNGEKVDLTEVGDVIDEISKDNMKQNEWYQVKTDGNGNVVKAEPAFYALDYYEFGEKLGRSAFTSEYEHINDVVEVTGVTTVVYHEDNGPASNMKEDNHNKNHINTNYECSHNGFYADDKLEVKGNNVLAVNTRTGSGIYFRNDVNVVLVYWNRNTNNTDVMLGEGVEDLKDMVDYVNENSAAAKLRNDSKDRLASETYFLSALIENGAATTIVIQDRFNPYASGDHTDKPAGDQILTLGGIFNNTYETRNNSDVYLVSGRETTRLESIDDLGTATVNGFKRYEVRGGDRIRVLDKDLNKDFIPYFSPANTGNAYNFKLYADGVYAANPYIEFTMPKNSDLIVRQWQPGDEFGIKIPANVAVKINNNTAVTGPTTAVVKAGDVLTFTFDATKVEKVTVNGEDITASKYYKVKNTDYALDIAVTDKDTPPVSGVYTLKTLAHSKVTLNGTALADGAEVQAADISKLEVKPAEAVELKRDDAAKTITVQPIKPFYWTDAWGGLWMGKDSDDNIVMIPGAVASVARFKLARAASARVSDGEQNADTWIGDMMQDLRDNPTAKWEVKNAAGKTIWVAEKFGSGVKLVKAEGVTKVEADAAFESIDTCTIWRTTEGTTETGRTVVAKWNGTTKKYSFDVVGESGGLTNAEIIKAVKAQLTKDRTQYTDVTMDENVRDKVTIVDGTDKFTRDLLADGTAGSRQAPNVVYEVTISGTKYLVSDLNQISGLTDIYFLLPKATVAGTSPVTVTSGTPGSTAVTAKCEYVPAISVGDLPTAKYDSTATMKLEYEESEGKWKDVAANTHFQVGTHLRLHESGIAAGNEGGRYVLTLNANVNGGTKIEGSVAKLTAAATTCDLIFDLGEVTASQAGTLTYAVSDSLVKVTVEGKEIPNPDTKMGNWFKGDEKVKLDANYDWIVGEKYENVSALTLDANREISLTGLTATKGVIAFNKAVKVTTSDAYSAADDFEVYQSPLKDGAVDGTKKLTQNTTTWVAVDASGKATVYLKAYTQNSLMTPNTNSKYTLGKTIVEPATSVAGVWAVELDLTKGAFSATEFVDGLSVTAPGAQVLDLRDGKTPATIAITTVAATAGKGVDVKAVWKDDTQAGLKGTTLSAVITSGTTTTITVTPTAPVLKQEGTLRVTWTDKATLKTYSIDVRVSTADNSIKVANSADLVSAAGAKYSTIELDNGGTDVTLGAALTVQKGTTLDLKGHNLLTAGYTITVEDGASIINTGDSTKNVKVSDVAGKIVGAKNIVCNIEIAATSTADTLDGLSETSKLTITSGAVKFVGDVKLTKDNLAWTAGTIELAGAGKTLTLGDGVEVKGNVTITTGTLALAGDVTVADSTTITVASGQNMSFAGHTLTGAGTSSKVVFTGATVTGFTVDDQNFFKKASTDKLDDAAGVAAAFTWDDGTTKVTGWAADA